jgi:hypothetical protein
MNLNDDIETTVGNIKADMEESPPAKPKPKKVKKVAKKVSKKVKDEETAKPAKTAKKGGKTNGNGHAESDDGLITVAELAEEAGISPQSARVKLRAAELDRGEGRWKWQPGSKGLKSARKVLGLEG